MFGHWKDEKAKVKKRHEKIEKALKNGAISGTIKGVTIVNAGLLFPRDYINVKALDPTQQFLLCSVEDETGEFHKVWIPLTPGVGSFAKFVQKYGYPDVGVSVKLSFDDEALRWIFVL